MQTLPKTCVADPEYLRRTPPVAVRTADHAFVYFRAEQFDARPRTNQIADGAPLGAADVIEFEHDQIHDPAVRARMLA